MTSFATYACDMVPSQEAMQNMGFDKDGFINDFVIGAFNVDNESGIHYPLTQMVSNLFDKSSILQRRISRGFQKGECEHPNLSGMNKAQQISRILDIKKQFVSTFFRQIDLETGKDEHGTDLVLVKASFCPSGYYGPQLEKSIKNREENVAFSIRSLCKERMADGRVVRLVNNIITWDEVNEPGIRRANQFDSIGLESIDSSIFTPEELDSAIRTISTDQEGNVAGIECVESLAMVKDDLGWGKVPVLKTLSSSDW